MAGWAREPWGLWRRMLRRTWWASCDGERIYEVYRSFKRALDQHALFMNLLCCCWLSDNILRIELMDWASLKIRCGVSRGSAANQDLTWESPVRTTNMVTEICQEVLVCFCIVHLPALKSLPSSSLQMQLHPMMSTEVQSHTSNVENPLLAQLSLVESQLLALQDVTINTATLSRS
jgi:hypothetical protein